MSRSLPGVNRLFLALAIVTAAVMLGVMPTANAATTATPAEKSSTSTTSTSTTAPGRDHRGPAVLGARAAGRLRDATVVMADTCLDEFTDHGHCGVLGDDGGVDNDATLAVYAQMAVAQADAGAHLLGPSGMMDGQVGVIRAALDAAGHRDTGILAYTAKYASAFYGPFREAVESQLRGDRKTYQQDAANVRESLRELALDLEEGADLVMVKPAMAYLDVLRAVAEVADVPVAAYQVSGEYAMVEAAAANGWLDRERTILETLTAIRRAGADVVLTYWAVEVAARLDRD